MSPPKIHVPFLFLFIFFAVIIYDDVVAKVQTDLAKYAVLGMGVPAIAVRGGIFIFGSGIHVPFNGTPCLWTPKDRTRNLYGTVLLAVQTRSAHPQRLLATAFNLQCSTTALSSLSSTCTNYAPSFSACCVYSISGCIRVHGPSISTLYHHRPRYFLPAIQLPFQSHMSNQSGSSHLRALFEAALESYKHQTGIDLAEHPLAERLQDGDTVESVTAILCEQAQDFQKFREKDKLLKPLKKFLTVLNNVSSAVSLVCP